MNKHAPEVLLVTPNLLDHINPLNLATLESAEDTANAALADVKEDTSNASRVSHRLFVFVFVAKSL